MPSFSDRSSNETINKDVVDLNSTAQLIYGSFYSGILVSVQPRLSEENKP